MRLFLVCQACISAIGCKSRIRFTVRSISQEQGCRGRLRIWRKLAANIRAYEKKLHTRRGATGNVAKQTEARYCTELHNVNAEAAWMESGYTYPERSDDNLVQAWVNAEAKTGVSTKNNIMVLSEVSRSHSKPATSHNPWKRQRGSLTQGRRTEC
jgi:hypothetical protein